MTSTPAKNPVDVLREWLTKAGVYDDEPFAALADVARLEADRDQWKRVARQYESALSDRGLL